VATLLVHFSELFSIGLSLDDKLNRQEAQTKTADQVYAALRTRLDEARRSAQDDGKRAADIEAAAFAVVAWVDEVIARHHDWWSGSTPLQVTLFGTRNAGNEFFSHLEKLDAKQDEAREVYYVALCLGFQGQYYYDIGETGELARMKDLNSRQLPVAPAHLAAVADEKITAQPYSVQDPAGPKIPSKWPEWIAKSAVLVAVFAIAGVLGWQYWHSAPTPVPVPIQADLKREQIEAVLNPYRCHDFEIANKAGIWTVKGHVDGIADRQKVTDEIRKLKGGDKVEIALEELGEPFCQAVEIATPFARRNRGTGSALGVQLPAQMFEGDTVTLSVSLPKTGGCLYVDYLAADGKTVTHLFPNSTDKIACVAATDRPLIVGGPNKNGFTWKVSEPFGREMVLAVVSGSPLFKGLREEIEAPGEYLTALRAALAGASDNDVADYSLVLTAKHAGGAKP